MKLWRFAQSRLEPLFPLVVFVSCLACAVLIFWGLTSPEECSSSASVSTYNVRVLCNGKEIAKYRGGYRLVGARHIVRDSLTGLDVVITPSAGTVVIAEESD